jgi:hypothetical protein
MAQRSVWILIGCTVLADASADADEAANLASVDFQREIRPILFGRCVECHGPDVQEAGLRLDRRETATAILASGARAVVPGDPSAGAWLARVSSADPDFRMPPGGARPPLSADEIDALRRWIAAGAEWPTHWAYLPPEAVEIPVSPPSDWPDGPIDAFLLAAMRREGAAPSPPARRETLMRRAFLDLVGLPPTIEEQDAFLADDRPDAYERLVDKLLASPRYGERRAIAWLDLARYADTDGYALDFDRSIWPYRDWVVAALNEDMPFDQFTVEQLAGDLLPGATVGQRVATGLHRNTRISTEAGSDPEEYRIEAVLDRVGTTASIWLGSTLACAQCHNHKFDPFTQADFYKFFAFFNQCAVETTRDEAGQIKNVSPRVEFFTEVQLAERTELEARLATASSADERKRLERAREEIRPIQSLTMEDQAEPRTTRIFHRGSFLNPGDEVSADVPEFLKEVAGSANGSDRLALARWIVNRRNPLTARVAINRWHREFFGVAMVDTLDDFGSQSPPVRMRELLDWLAVEFMDSGWRVKRMHRAFATSAAYRQSSDATPSQWEADPENRRLARMSRIRLPAEVVRDNALAAGGVLSSRIGGRPVHAASMKYLGSEDTSYRRSIYVLWKRSALDATFAAFDAPPRDVCCAQREPTNTPLQALDLLNDRVFLDAARGLADRVLSEAQGSVERLRLAFRIVLARRPSDEELEAMQDFLDRRRAEYSQDAALATAFLAAGGVPPPAGVAAPDAAAWTLAANALLNLNETVTRE